MSNRNSPPTWPMDATTLPQPGVGSGLATRAALSVGFCGATAFLFWQMSMQGGFAQGWANAVPLVAGACLVAAAVALAAFARVVLRVLRNGPVWHAAASVLPDVPAEPIIAGKDFFQLSPSAHYMLKPVEWGWWFGPRSSPLQVARRSGALRFILVGIGAETIVWCLGHGMLMLKCLCTAATLTICGLVCAGVWFLSGRLKTLPSVVIDEPLQVCEIGPQPVTRIPLKLAVAIQLCACRPKRQDPRAEGVEANLVWRTAGAADEPVYQRTPLMFFTRDLGRKARLAGQLAEKLGVPLLCHASAEHWAIEHARAKQRSFCNSYAAREGGMQGAGP